MFGPMEGDPSRFPAAALDIARVASRRLLERDGRGLPDAIRDGRGLPDAIWHGRGLPSGRPAGPSDHLAVPVEGVGTCSTKHALLARVCDEQGIGGVQLTLGICDVTESNTPGLGPVLADWRSSLGRMASVDELWEIRRRCIAAPSTTETDRA